MAKKKSKNASTTGPQAITPDDPDLHLTEHMWVEAALCKANERLNLALEGSSGVTWGWDVSANRFDRWTPAYRDLYGFSPDDPATFDTWLARIHPADRERMKARFKTVLKTPGDEVWHEEFRIVHPIRGVRWLSRVGQRFRDASGRIRRVCGVTFDITVQKQSEEALRESRERLAFILSQSPVVVYACTAEGDFGATFISDNVRAQLGYEPGQFLADSKFWINHVHPEDRPRVTQDLRQLFERGSYVHEYRFRAKDGTWRWMVDKLTLVRDSKGRPVEIVGHWIDETDRKAAEGALRASEERLRLALSAGKLGTWDWNLATDELAWSPRQYELFGIRPEDFRANGTQALAAIHPEDRPHVEAAILKARKELGAFEATFRVVHADRSMRWLIGVGQIQKDESGNATRMIGVNFDVTEQKRGEALLKDFSAQLEQQVARRTAELLERKDRLRAVLGALTAHVAVLDRDGWIVAVNPAWEAFARDNGGAPERCCVGVNYLDVCRRVPKGDADAELARQVEAGLRDVLAGRIPEFTIEYPFCSSREIRWFLLQAAGLRREHGGAVVSHLNITSRVKAERVVRDKENRLRAILENAFSAIVTIDSRGIIEEFNKAAERMFGYSAEEVLGHNVKMLLPSPYRQQHDGYLRRYLETGEAHLLGTVREVQALRKDGSLIDVALSVSQVDHLGLFTGIFFDISRRKELEREVVEIASSEQRRIGSDLHDSVGQELTALNLLAGDLAEALHTDPSHAGPMIDRMVQGLNRCQRELRAVMRGLLPVEVDTEGLMAALSDLAERTRKDGIETCTFDCPVPVAVPDNLTATHLYLIAQEAVRNAIKHARPRNIRISLESNGLLVLSVQDDGIGMPVQTTESPGGLGLRIMRNRAAIIGATLTIQSAEPTGTLVRCVL